MNPFTLKIAKNQFTKKRQIWFGKVYEKIFNWPSY